MSNMLSPIDFRHMDYPEVFEDEVNRLADLIASSRHFYKLSVEVLKNSAYWNSDNFQDKFRDFLVISISFHQYQRMMFLFFVKDYQVALRTQRITK